MINNFTQQLEKLNIPLSKLVQQRKKWEFQESFKYYEFVQQFKDVLEKPQKKQKQRIYNKMAAYIGSRSTHQCRSHHQKVMKCHHSIIEFVKSFKAKLQEKKNGENCEKKLRTIRSRKKKLYAKINKSQLDLNQITSSINQFKIKELNGRRSKSQVIKRQSEQQRKNQIDFESQEEVNQPFRPFSKILDEYKNKIDFSRLRVKGGFLQYQSDSNSSSIQKDLINKKQDRLNALFGQGNFQINRNDNLNEFQNSDQQMDMMQEDLNYRYNKNLHLNNGQKLFRTKDINYIPRSLNHIQLAKKLQKTGLGESLTATPESLLQNASYICSSILKGKKCQKISKLIQQNTVQLTQNLIKINYKQEENFKIWIEYSKPQKKHQKSGLQIIEGQKNPSIIRIANEIPIKQGNSQSNINQYHPNAFQNQRIPCIFQTQFKAASNQKTDDLRFINNPRFQLNSYPPKQYYSPDQISRNFRPRYLDLQYIYNQRQHLSLPYQNTQRNNSYYPLRQNQDHSFFQHRNFMQNNYEPNQTPIAHHSKYHNYDQPSNYYKSQAYFPQYQQNHNSLFYCPPLELTYPKSYVDKQSLCSGQQSDYRKSNKQNSFRQNMRRFQVKRDQSQHKPVRGLGILRSLGYVKQSQGLKKNC